MLLVEYVVAFTAPFVHRINLGAVGDDEVVVHISGCPRSSAGVGCKYAAALKNVERLDSCRVKQALGNLVAGENLARYSAVGIGYLSSGIVNGYHLPLRVHPAAEVAIVHFRRRNGG